MGEYHGIHLAMSHSHNDGLSEPRKKSGGDTFGAWLPIVCADRLVMDRKVRCERERREIEREKETVGWMD